MIQVKGIIRCALVDFQGFHHRDEKKAVLSVHYIPQLIIYMCEILV